ncbi:MAG: hydroxymethylpyrimidine/phosphomethylpyrimidine kinase, partial [Nitrosomonas sp.]|nr:hydroxymethylpyrimidine/phosphomethylpyrimidine kinase [Nitrosomonas sp.]
SLANGISISESVIDAQDYTWHALQAGFRPGMGQYIPNRLFWAKNEDDIEDENEEGAIEKPKN